ncbi:MAG: magnesium transporter [Methanobrevibacter sp.]|nr:magnesium transporter [Methanobrevibacter sp.]
MKFIRHLLSNIINLPVYISRKIISDENKDSFLKNNKKIILQGLTALLICVVGDLFAGIILTNMTDYLKNFPGLIVLIPGAIGMRGNIYGALASRLGTNLHIGTLSSKLKKSDILSQNIQSSIILSLLLSLLLGILAKITCVLLNFDSISLVDFILISGFSALISSLILLPATIIIPIKSFQNGWDPDNITIPIITALGDLFTLPSMIISVYLILFIHNPYLKTLIAILLILFTLIYFYFAYKSDSNIKKILKQNTPVLFLSSLMGISAGQVLNNSMAILLKNQEILSLIPLFSGGTGGLLSILSGRLTSAIHSGIIEPCYKLSEELLKNFKIILILSIILYPLIGILVESNLYLFASSQAYHLIVVLISIISGLILIPILMFIVLNISIFSYNHGLDPDNIDVPIETSITDFLSNIMLIVVSLLFIRINFL